MGLFSRKSALEKSYDAIAEEYARRTQYELYSRPRLRELIDHFAEAVAESGPCCDVGCGSGHITHYLREKGVDACGLDQSGKMLKQARRHYPGIKFHQGDLQELDFKDHQFASVVALNALSHVEPSNLTNALLELRRILEPEGALMLGFYTGNFSEQVRSWWGHDVELTFHCYRSVDMVVYLQNAGFKELTVHVRNPSPDESFQCRQTFIVAEALPGIPPARRSKRVI